eukprot:2357728-Prymnesium_polylepis.2
MAALQLVQTLDDTVLTECFTGCTAPDTNLAKVSIVGQNNCAKTQSVIAGAMQQSQNFDVVDCRSNPDDYNCVFHQNNLPMVFQYGHSLPCWQGEVTEKNLPEFVNKCFGIPKPQ